MILNILSRLGLFFMLLVFIFHTILPISFPFSEYFVLLLALSITSTILTITLPFSACFGHYPPHFLAIFCLFIPISLPFSAFFVAILPISLPFSACDGFLLGLFFTLLLSLYSPFPFHCPSICYTACAHFSSSS